MKDNNLLVNSNIIYVIPIENKPIKIVYEDLPCPINNRKRCKYAKFINTKKFEYELKCTADSCQS